MKGRTILLIVLGVLLLHWLLPTGLLPSFLIQSPRPFMQMHSINPGVLIIFMVFAIPLVAIIGGCFIAALKVLKGDGGRNPGARKGGPFQTAFGGAADDDLPADEAALIQEMHRSLTRMDKRIEALETILLERRPPPIPETERVHR
jgi:hypothetical protein